MSLVTRCPACETTFRVVRDQLRISEGWVRCGRCSEVFDATLALTDSETGEAVPAGDIIVKLPSVPTESAGGLPPDVLAGSPLPSVPSFPPFPAVSGMPVTQQAEPGASPFDDLDAGLQTIAAHASDAAPQEQPKPLAVNWPGAGLLDLGVDSATKAAEAEPDQLVPMQPEPASSPPAWRQIQAPPGLAAVFSDAPRRERQRQALPAEGEDTGSASLIEAAVDAQLKKELRRVRAEAFRDGLVSEQRALAAEVEAPAPAKQEPPADDAQAASVLLQASRDPSAGARTDEPRTSPADAARRRIGASAARRQDMSEAEDSRAAVLPTFAASEPAVLSAAKTGGSAKGLARGLLLGLLTVTAAVVLVAQYLRHERDTLAAANPALRPLVEGMCRHTGCEVAAPRRIDAVRIDGSSFTPDRSGEHHQLMFTLRNAAPTPIAMPSIELSLLDANERPLIRRVFHPADFGAPARMAGRADQHAQLDMVIRLPADHAGPGVVGYSMLAFYP